MAEHDDRELSARYRALPDEVPPASIDAAVLAAARRDVEMRRASGLRRWTVPVSIAAVVLLSVLVTLRIDGERPDTEVLRKEATPARPAPLAEEARQNQPAAQKGSEPFSAIRQRPMPTQTPSAPADAARSPPPAGQRTAPLPAPAERERGFAAGAARESRDSVSASRPKAEAAKRKQSADTETPQAWLERIARLRKEGRVEEAEKALKAFFRAYPDYEIPEAMNEAVRGPE